MRQAIRTPNPRSAWSTNKALHGHSDSELRSVRFCRYHDHWRDGHKQTSLKARIVFRLAVCALFLAAWNTTRADEGGVAFWLSGQYASFAATPQPPGLYLPAMTYFYHGEAAGGVEFERGGGLDLNLQSDLALTFIAPTVVPDIKILGGQPSIGMAFGGGYNRTEGTVVLNILGHTFRRNRVDDLWGITDLYPNVNLAWNVGVNNFMVYVTGDGPIGSYDANRLAIIGIGHAAVDWGGGYTYLNPKTGLEISAVGGFTYNLENENTHYQNGVDSHLDYAVSQFLSENFHVGVTGYLYYQLTGDSGGGDIVGSFKSKVAAIGGEIGYLFKLGGHEAYANARGYYEYWAENRLQGYAVYAAVNIPLGGPKEAAPAQPHAGGL